MEDTNTRPSSPKLKVPQRISPKQVQSRSNSEVEHFFGATRPNKPNKTQQRSHLVKAQLG